MNPPGSYEEVLEFAIDREIDANQFYLALAERVDSTEMREVFEDLAGEELEHVGADACDHGIRILQGCSIHGEGLLGPGRLEGRLIFLGRPVFPVGIDL